MIIDHARGWAYTHLWEGKTVVIDVHTRAIVEQWPNGCSGSRGIALDEKRGFLFAGCAEGKAIEGAHCTTGDNQGNIWVCDPQHGQLLLFKDRL